MRSLVWVLRTLVRLARLPLIVMFRVLRVLMMVALMGVAGGLGGLGPRRKGSENLEADNPVVDVRTEEEAEEEAED